MTTAIITVSYHTGPVLFQALQAALAQDAPIRLIVVDNGNPPDVITRLQSMAATEPRLSLVTGHGNVGFGTGCNLGAKAADDCDFLLFLNPDSLLPADAVSRLLVHTRVLRAAPLPAPFLVGARLLDEDGNDQRGCRRALLTPTTALIEALHLGRFFPRIRLNFTSEPIPVHLTEIPAISGAFMFLPRVDFQRIGGFDEAYFLHVEDLDICLRFRRAGGTIWFAPDIVVTHIGGTSGATTAFVEKHKARGFIRYFRTHFSDTCPAPLLGFLTCAVWLRTWMKIGCGLLRRNTRRPMK